MPRDLIEQRTGAHHVVQVGTYHQPWAGRRRKRNGYGELRIIAAADARVRLGPRKIKHELAVRVSLDESRRGGGEALRIGKGDISRIPTRAGPDAVRVLQRGDELMSQERVAVSPQRIPLHRIELVDAVVDLGSWRRLCQECFSTSMDSR